MALITCFGLESTTSTQDLLRQLTVSNGICNWPLHIIHPYPYTHYWHCPSSDCQCSEFSLVWLLTQCALHMLVLSLFLWLSLLPSLLSWWQWWEGEGEGTKTTTTVTTTTTTITTKW